MIDSVRALGPTLVVDTGDFLGSADKTYGYDTDLMLSIMRLIGEKLEAMITRILGVILAALAAQFIIDGLKQSFPSL